MERRREGSQVHNKAKSDVEVPMEVNNSSFLVEGPLIQSVLYDQNSHITDTIWRTEAEHIVTPRHSILWPKTVPQSVEKYLCQAGFLGLFHIGRLRLDKNLITGFVERWRPETHTFHIPQGEITITLQDVEILLGIPIKGSPLIGDMGSKSMKDLADDVERALGRRPSDRDISSKGLKMGWIKENICNRGIDVTEEYFQNDDESIQRYTRGIILLILGGAFFADKSGTYVRLNYLPMISDLTACGAYSWGSGMLAYLYRELCKAAKGAANIGGAMVLLQLWAWTRFPSLSPSGGRKLGQATDPRLPYGYRVLIARRTYNPDIMTHRFQRIRYQLALLQNDEVEWEPYREIVHASQVLWRARVPLLHFCIVEFHYPDRVMRQFGLKQNIPEYHYQEDPHLHKMRRSGIRETILVSYVNMWNHPSEDGEVDSDPMEDRENYLAWYNLITLRLVLKVIKIELSDSSRPFSYIEQNVNLAQNRKLPQHTVVNVCVCEENGNSNSVCGAWCFNTITSCTECPPGFCRCVDYCRTRRIRSCEYAKIKLFKTVERGMGLQTRKEIKAGQFIMEYIGEIISSAEAAKRSKAYASQGVKDAYMILLANNSYLDATTKGNYARFINHSCQPNCEIKKWRVKGELRVGIYAKEDIEVGVELAYDYNGILYGGADVRCLCGAPNCRNFFKAIS